LRLSPRTPSSVSASSSGAHSKWTAFAGVAAAKAAAEESEDGYRTASMSSVSDNTLSGYGESDREEDEDDDGEDGGFESDQEDEGGSSSYPAGRNGVGAPALVVAGPGVRHRDERALELEGRA